MIRKKKKFPYWLKRIFLCEIKVKIISNERKRDYFLLDIMDKKHKMVKMYLIQIKKKERGRERGILIKNNNILIYFKINK